MGADYMTATNVSMLILRLTTAPSGEYFMSTLIL